MKDLKNHLRKAYQEINLGHNPDAIFQQLDSALQQQDPKVSDISFIIEIKKYLQEAVQAQLDASKNIDIWGISAVTTAYFGIREQLYPLLAPLLENDPSISIGITHLLSIISFGIFTIWRDQYQHKKEITSGKNQYIKALEEFNKDRTCCNNVRDISSDILQRVDKVLHPINTAMMISIVLNRLNTK